MKGSATPASWLVGLGVLLLASVVSVSVRPHVANGSKCREIQAHAEEYVRNLNDPANPLPGARVVVVLDGRLLRNALDTYAGPLGDLLSDSFAEWSPLDQPRTRDTSPEDPLGPGARRRGRAAERDAQRADRADDTLWAMAPGGKLDVLEMDLVDSPDALVVDTKLRWEGRIRLRELLVPFAVAVHGRFVFVVETHAAEEADTIVIDATRSSLSQIQVDFAQEAGGAAAADSTRRLDRLRAHIERTLEATLEAAMQRRALITLTAPSVGDTRVRAQLVSASVVRGDAVVQAGFRSPDGVLPTAAAPFSPVLRDHAAISVTAADAAALVTLLLAHADGRVDDNRASADGGTRTATVAHVERVDLGAPDRITARARVWRYGRTCVEAVLRVDAKPYRHVSDGLTVNLRGISVLDATVPTWLLRSAIPPSDAISDALSVQLREALARLDMSVGHTHRLEFGWEAPRVDGEPDGELWLRMQATPRLVPISLPDDAPLAEETP